jgi:hypothetical protein
MTTTPSAPPPLNSTLLAKLPSLGAAAAAVILAPPAGPRSSNEQAAPERHATSNATGLKAYDSQRSMALRVPDAVVQSSKHEPPAPPLQISTHDHAEVPIKAFLLPKEIYDHIVEAGAKFARARCLLVY